MLVLPAHHMNAEIMRDQNSNDTVGSSTENPNTWNHIYHEIVRVVEVENRQDKHPEDWTSGRIMLIETTGNKSFESWIEETCSLIPRL